MKLRTLLPLLAAGLVTVLAVAGFAGAAGNPPKNTSLPTITGTTEQGQTLTAHAGQWTGDQPISYKWRWKRCNAFGQKCANITGATNSTLTRNNVQAANAGSYTVVIGNSSGSVTSAPAVLTVRTPPAITTQPANQTVSPGSSPVLSIRATGWAPLGFQWRYTPNPGVTLPMDIPGAGRYAIIMDPQGATIAVFAGSAEMST